MKKWQTLQKGDLIDIVAPASHGAVEGLAKIKEFLQDQGYRVRIPKDIYKPQLFLSNTDEKRFEFLKNALLAEDSKAIWCVRGGYGSLRLYDELLKLKKPKICKLFIGLSDITSLHIFLNQKWNWPTFHGANINYLSESKLSEKNIKEYFEVLSGKKKEIIFKKLKPVNAAAQKVNHLKSSIRGGNLISVQSTFGTPLSIDLEDQILFMEEIAEKGYRIDRILTQLIQTQSLKKAKAILLGDFTDCIEADGQVIVHKVIKNWADTLKIPVFKGVPSGHGKVQRIVPFNTPAVIKKSRKDFECSVKVGS